MIVEYLSPQVASRMEKEELCGACCHSFDLLDRRPKVLPCGHVICFTCLQPTLQSAVCPVCQTLFPLDGAVLPDCFSILEKLAVAANRTGRPLWCVECSSVANADCVDTHTLWGLRRAIREYEPTLQGLVTTVVGDLGGACRCAQQQLQHHPSEDRVLDALRLLLDTTPVSCELSLRCGEDADTDRDSTVTYASTWELERGPLGPSSPVEDRLVKLLALLLMGAGRLRQSSLAKTQFCKTRSSPVDVKPDLASLHAAVSPSSMPAVTVVSDFGFPGWPNKSPKPPPRSPPLLLEEGLDLVGSSSPDMASVDVKAHDLCTIKVFSDSVENLMQVDENTVQMQTGLREQNTATVDFPDAIEQLDLHDVSLVSSNAQAHKKDVLEVVATKGVRRLTRLNCHKDPAWSLDVLKQAVPLLLEELDIRYASWEHIQAMNLFLPRLRRLSVSGVRALHRDKGTADALPDGERVGQELPARPVHLPGVSWLRASDLPRLTLQSLLREHRHDLRELCLTVGTGGSDQRFPYSGGDLRTLLLRCQLASLETLVLVRDNCLHVSGRCVAQRSTVRGVVPAGASVICTTCDNQPPAQF